MKPFVILSDRAKIVGIHWLHGRSQPCPKQDDSDDSCEACRKQLPNYKGYLAAWYPDTNETFVIEFTPPVFETLSAWRQLYTSLRGTILNLTRKGTKPNGPLSATITQSDIPPATIPPAFDVIPVMEDLWCLPDNPKNKRGTELRDGMHETSEETKILNLLKAQGVIDANGNPIKPVETAKNEKAKPPKPTKPKEENDTAFEAKRAAFLERVNKKRADAEGASLPSIGPTYTLNDDQKTMLERNRNNHHHTETTPCPE